MEEKNRNKNNSNNYYVDALAEYDYDGYKQYVFSTGSDLFYNNNPVYSVSNSSSDFLYETYYTLDGRYNVLTNSSGVRVIYIPEKYVEHEERLTNKIEKYTTDINNSSPLACIKNNLALKCYALKTHAVPLLQNDEVFLDPSDKRVMEYNVMKNIYPKLVFIMPYFHAKNVLEDSLSQIYNFIATHNLDINHIVANIESIRTCQFCSSSIALLEEFIANPKKADLREITDKISHSIQNIDNIIELNGYKDFENTK